eukprot:jgi/Astpho2/6048/Aster-04001
MNDEQAAAYKVTAIRVTPQLNAQAALTAPGASQAAPSSLLLQGSLPGDASQLSALQVMEIAGQRVSGSLPPQWGDMEGLAALILQNNSLTGQLPQSWASMASLQLLNLSYNGLSGPVPASWTSLRNLSAMSVLGNSMLCRQGAIGNAAVDGAQQTLPACSPVQLAQAPAGPMFPVMPVTTPTPAPQQSYSPFLTTSMGTLIAVSVMIGLCLMLGVTAGLIRIRQQHRSHQAFLTAARQRIEELSRVERDLHSRYGHGGGGAPGDLPAFSSEFDIQPHLVLDPDGVSILMARKLKQQSEDGAGEGAGGAPGTEQAPERPVESTLPNSRRTTVSESGLLVVAGQQHSDAPQQEELTRVSTGTLADYWGVQAQSGRHASGQLLGGEPQVQGHGLQGPGPWRVAPLFTALLECEQLPAAGQMLAPVDRVQKLPERATQGALPSRASVEASGPSSTSAAAPATTPPQSAPNQSAQPPDIEQGLSTPQLAPPPNRSWFRLPLRQTQQ